MYADPTQLKHHSQAPSQLKSAEKDAFQLKASQSPIQQAANESPQVKQLAKLQAAQLKAPGTLEASTIQAKKPEQDPVPKHNTDAFEKKRQKKSLAKAVIEANKIVNKAKKAVSKDNRAYKRWMDAGKVDTGNTDKRVSYVKDGIDKIANVLAKEEIIFKKYDLNDGEEAETYAYVYKEDAEHNMYLGGGFWDARTGGNDSRAGTIIHELSHRVHDTEDHVYGREDAKALAKEDPEKAVTNADSYEFLAEAAR